MPVRLAILRSGSREQYEPLAERLGIPLVDEISDSYDYLLRFTPDRLELIDAHEIRSQPIAVDFLSKESLRRVRTLGKSDLLVRATRFRRAGRAPRLIDATAGLGEDSICFGSLGFEVTMIERSPLIFELLSNGLARAQSAGLPYAKHISVIACDTQRYLSELPAHNKPDMIYLDPMYPPRRGAAQGCKQLRVLRDIVGEDPDADALLDIALRNAGKKVVVKRPRLAERLRGPGPHHEIVGRSIRYDVYLTAAGDDVAMSPPASGTF